MQACRQHNCGGAPEALSSSQTHWKPRLSVFLSQGRRVLPRGLFLQGSVRQADVAIGEIPTPLTPTLLLNPSFIIENGESGVTGHFHETNNQRKGPRVN